MMLTVKLSRIGLTNPQHAAFTTGLEGATDDLDAELLVTVHVECVEGRGTP